MRPDDLQAFLRTRIPLSNAMAVEVRAASADEVTLSVPIVPNVKHRDTVFGGSASALAILAAWAKLRTALKKTAALPLEDATSAMIQVGFTTQTSPE